MKRNTAPSGVGLRHDRRHLVDHVVEPGNRIVPGADGLTSPLNEPVPQISKNDADDDPRQQRRHTSARARLRPRRGRRRHGRRGLSAARNAGESHSSFGCQTLRNSTRQAIEIERRADIDDPRIDVVGNQELRHRERHAGNQDRRPDLPACRGNRQRPRSARTARSREERQLPADHGAEQERINTRGSSISARRSFRWHVSCCS